MREVGKYYWAKFDDYSYSLKEVVQYAGSVPGTDYFVRNGRNEKFDSKRFYWISDTPIEEPKEPLKNGLFYVVHYRNEKDSKYLALYKDGYFYANHYERHNRILHETDVEVLSQPFTADEVLEWKKNDR